MTRAGGGIVAVVRGLAVALVVAASLDAQGAASFRAGFAPVDATPASEFELKDTAGKSHRLSDYRGRVVLVNFWATWCEPCRDEMPSMQKLKERADRSAPGSLIVLGVNYGESAARVESFLKQMPLGFPLLLDPFSEVSRLWKPGVLPASFLVGKDGRIHYRVIGEIDWAGAEAAAVIRRLLDAKV